MNEDQLINGLYGELPATGPNATALGTAFITLVEPHVGNEQAYNRWYEDDHFYSGAMSFPWWFAGRRWVATRELRDLRQPSSSPIVEPVDLGCYLGTYWVTAGRHDEQLRWLHGTVTRLAAEGRMFAERTHIHTSYYERVGARRVGSAGPMDIHALDYPYSGLVLEIVDARDGFSRQQLISDLLEDGLSGTLREGVVDLCIVMVPKEWPPSIERWFDHAPTPANRVALLWFTLTDPRQCWDRFDRGQRPLSAAAASTLVAGFIPTLPGTDTYVDQLR